MSQLLSEDEWAKALWDFEHTAFRLELQSRYTEPSEEPFFRRFIAGDRTPQAWPEWRRRVELAIAEGKRIERVRVLEDPPTDYQCWLRWASMEIAQAGEIQRHLTRARAEEIGLVPAAGDGEDWWLLDSSRLVVMRFTPDGRRYENELIADPERVVQACAWRDLAIQHSTPEKLSGLVA